MSTHITSARHPRPLLDPRLAELADARLALGPCGFLPARIPAHPRASSLAALGRALPARYHAPDADVRPWLREVEWPSGAVDRLDPDQLDDCMVVVTHLAHAYRWGGMPASAAGRARIPIDLPPGLARLWDQLAARLEVPRCGNLYHMVLHNWRIQGSEPGAAYGVDQLVAGEPAPLVSWLCGREAEELAAFAGSVVLTEAHGAAAVDLALPLLGAVVRGDAPASAALLGRLIAVIAEIGRVFARAIRKQQVRPHTFLTLIQPHFLWGLEHQGEVLEGASGAQTPTLQLLDGLLAVPRESPVARAAAHSRAGLPPRHRRFLTAVDALGGELRAFVSEAGDPELTERYNACLLGLQHWRRVHQKRGALYLAGDPQQPEAEYSSVGRVVEGAGDRVDRFDAAMEAHLRETAAALVPTGAGPTTCT